ncbi:AAA family ATPase [Tatumella sp. UCD-D_suzukii]|uniref:AAA family ATPase n=1 Tax=Tatumella sp. UCD-D_suzukii TaxID=1408192 RepID=UPI0004725B5E|nr:AAA family ATPase [Tatumella sp. UCD-D_suzukii]
MLLRDISIRNIGPIESLDISLKLNDNLNPKPAILVGKNGAGKTYTISYIVDSIYEIAKKSFNDIVSKASPFNNPFFRIQSGKDVRIGSEEGGAVYIRYTDNHSTAEIHYLEKIGNNISAMELIDLYGGRIGNNLKENSQKETHMENTTSEDFFKRIAIYFPSFRKIAPHWLNLGAQIENIFSTEAKFSGKLNKEIMCFDTFGRNIQWILDVVLDSSILPAELDHIKNDKDREREIKNKHLINNSYRNINKIFQIILEEEGIYLKTGWRNNSESRLSLHKNGKVFVPTLEQLSTGQLVLLNLFITIIRHADYSDLNKSINLGLIEGVVIIDEIDIHLHSRHQSEILPNLISLFPKVQFILTSHSPLFVLGMQQKLGDDAIQIIDLPSGNNITSERFSEFSDSMSVYQRTLEFEKTLHKKSKEQSKPLILVEGKTDIKYLKRSFEVKGKEHWLSTLEIDEIGFTNDNGSVKFGGDSNLTKGFDFLKYNSKSINRKVLFLYDCDTKIKDENFDGVYRNKIPENKENKRVKKGSENLFREDLFIDDFYTKKEVIDDYGSTSTIRNFLKVEFCEAIIKSNDHSIFDKYEENVFPIIERFLS